MRKLLICVPLACAVYLLGTTANAHCVRAAWMISQTVCVYCDMARAFFVRNNIPLEEYNLDDRRNFRWNVGDLPVGTVRAFAQRRYGWVATPILEIDGVVIRGYNLPAIQKETCTYN